MSASLKQSCNVIERKLPLSRHLTPTNSSSWPVMPAQSERMSETNAPSFTPMIFTLNSHGYSTSDLNDPLPSRFGGSCAAGDRSNLCADAIRARR
eukprot:CAMPEP_0119375822 /NCGR_PEP_ID=MMETSP1334-20130426/36722_1 /TAXON_ID=127549 /ORGANISM="Calcidiscus leptoporus, Strain RCC1130" /LENGTH=94 /DNA_ID=CAMNT_0007394219 /DNA_START=262 /DNA_END=546 /DNA_ORIENTATION=+